MSYVICYRTTSKGHPEPKLRYVSKEYPPSGRCDLTCDLSKAIRYDSYTVACKVQADFDNYRKPYAGTGTGIQIDEARILRVAEATHTNPPLSVAQLRQRLAYAPADTPVNAIICPHGDTPQDFEVCEASYDKVADAFDLRIRLPEHVALVHGEVTKPANHLERLAAELQELRAKGVAGPLSDDIVIGDVCYLVTITTEVEEPDAPKQVWSSGWNIPGYLPEVEPLNFDTWQQAIDALLDEATTAYDTAETNEDAQLYLDAKDQIGRLEPDTNACLRVGNYIWWVQQIILL